MTKLEQFREMVLPIQDEGLISRIKFVINMLDDFTGGHICEYCGGTWGDHASTKCGKLSSGGGRYYPEEWPIAVYTMSAEYPNIDKLMERYNDIFGLFIEPRARMLFGTKDMTKPIEQMRDLIAKMQKGS